MNVFRDLLAIIRIGLEWARDWQRKRSAAKYQREMANLEEDPADWLGQHFNGMPIDGDDAGGPASPDPAKHDQER